MHYTTNYKLPQWVETDRIMMEDFNDAMEKIEEGLTAGKTAAEEGQQALSESLAALSETVAAHQIAVGSYTGNDGTQTIKVGFTPKAVLVHNQRGDVTDGHLSALAITGKSAKEQYNNTTLLEITTNGFKVIHGNNASVNSSYYNYHYLAIC